MVFLGSEKKAAARAPCLQQLMNRKPAIRLQHSPHLSREQHWEQQLGTTRDQSWGQAAHGGTEGSMPSASRDGSCHLPCCAEPPGPAGGEADMLQLRLIRGQEKHSAWETDSTEQDLSHTRLLPPPSVRGVDMGSRETAGAWDTPEHGHRSTSAQNPVCST